MEGTHDRAMARDPHTGSSLACPAGYITPAAMGKAARLYISAHMKLNLTRRKTVRERSTRVNKLDKSEETRMKDALDNATSPRIVIRNL